MGFLASLALNSNNMGRGRAVKEFLVPNDLDGSLLNAVHFLFLDSTSPCTVQESFLVLQSFNKVDWNGQIDPIRYPLGRERDSGWP